MVKIIPPRLRIFSGPNGSGKTTIKSLIKEDLIGIYINPDDIQKTIQVDNFLDLTPYQVTTSSNEIFNFFSTSNLLKNTDLIKKIELIQFAENKLFFKSVEINAYFASVIADFIRRKLLEKKISFSFETVMSSSDKVELLSKAQQEGYRTYMYYVATDDPQINISRVQNRVQMGGHSVPDEKIINRYYRSINLLSRAISCTNRAYIFDNSSHELVWLAEITDGRTIEIKSNLIPKWFKESVLEKENL